MNSVGGVNRYSDNSAKTPSREEALEVVQVTLEEETGEPGVEAVYFTSFVMQ